MKVDSNYTSFYCNKTVFRLVISVFFISLISIGESKAGISNVKEKKNAVVDEEINVFEVLAAPQTITIEKGGSASVDITVNRASDFTGVVNLSIFPSPGLPANVTAPFSPSSVPSNSSSSVLTLNIGEAAVSGTYNVVVAGTGSKDGTTRLRTVSIALTIEDVQPAGVVASFNLLNGSNPINGLSDISNDITLDTKDLPSVLNFSANTRGAVTAVEWIFREQNGNTIQTSTDNSEPYWLYQTSGWTVSTGIYELQAVQVNSTERGEVKRITITIKSAPAPTFTITASPSVLSVSQGESIGTVVTLSPENNFTGQVDLVTENLPSGVDGFFSVTTLNTEGTSNLRFVVSETAPVGRYSVRINALGPTELSSETIVELNINRASTADFELSANVSALNIIKGETGKVNFTVRPLNGFNKAVNLRAVASDDLLNFEFRPAEIANGNGTSELTILTDIDQDLGSRDINISAISDTLVKELTITLTIDPIPIVISPTNQFSPNGDGIDDTWVINKIEEFTDYTVVVFDRSGKEVLKARPYQNDWNGTNKSGVDLLPTTYFFTIKDPDGRVVDSGTVNLLR